MANTVSERKESDLDQRVTFHSIFEKITNCSDLNSICQLLCDYYLEHNVELLSLSLADLRGEKQTIRAFNNLPTALHKVSLELREQGGCPVTREAKKVRCPFDVMQMDMDLYPSFLDRRFIRETEKLGYQKVIAVPIVLGRGMASFLFGMRTGSVNSGALDELVDEVCKFTIAIVSRFPDVLKLFEGGRLGALEAKCLLLLSNGHNMNEVAKVLDLSDLTIRILIKCAIRKLGAKTQYNAISLALSSGEISNLKLGRHELM